MSLSITITLLCLAPPVLPALCRCTIYQSQLSISVYLVSIISILRCRIYFNGDQDDNVRDLIYDHVFCTDPTKHVSGCVSPARLPARLPAFISFLLRSFLVWFVS